MVAAQTAPLGTGRTGSGRGSEYILVYGWSRGCAEGETDHGRSRSGGQGRAQERGWWWAWEDRRQARIYTGCQQDGGRDPDVGWDNTHPVPLAQVAHVIIPVAGISYRQHSRTYTTGVEHPYERRYQRFMYKHVTDDFLLPSKSKRFIPNFGEAKSEKNVSTNLEKAK